MASDGYKLAETLGYATEECLLEVGAGVSTEWLAALARQREVPFYSIDVDRDAHQASRLPRGVAICAHAEAVLATWGERPRPRFAWLDGYDWPYSWMTATHPAFARARSRYAARGEPLTAEASRRSHYDIIVLLEPLMRVGALVVFDDTWHNGVEWMGKGAAAIPFMLDRGWTAEYYETAEEPEEAFVAMIRA